MTQRREEPVPLRLHVNQAGSACISPNHLHRAPPAPQLAIRDPGRPSPPSTPSQQPLVAGVLLWVPRRDSELACVRLRGTRANVPQQGGRQPPAPGRTHGGWGRGSRSHSPSASGWASRGRERQGLSAALRWDCPSQDTLGAPQPVEDLPTCRRCSRGHCRTTSCWCCSRPRRPGRGCRSNCKGPGRLTQPAPSA